MVCDTDTRRYIWSQFQEFGLDKNVPTETKSIILQAEIFQNSEEARVFTHKTLPKKY